MNETTLILRQARAEDAAALRVLAELDSGRPLEGEVVLALVGGELRAARSLADGRTIGDPFRPTSALRELLAVHARQLAADDGPVVRRGRVPAPVRHAHGAC
jgi:hypothetical protein